MTPLGHLKGNGGVPTDLTDLRQEKHAPSEVDVAAAEERMHNRFIMQSDW